MINEFSILHKLWDQTPTKSLILSTSQDHVCDDKIGSPSNCKSEDCRYLPPTHATFATAIAHDITWSPNKPENSKDQTNWYLRTNLEETEIINHCTSLPPPPSLCSYPPSSTSPNTQYNQFLQLPRPFLEQLLLLLLNWCPNPTKKSQQTTATILMMMVCRDEPLRTQWISARITGQELGIERGFENLSEELGSNNKTSKFSLT